MDLPRAVLQVGAIIGYPMVVLITIVGIRMLLYYRSFFLHWPRYRHLTPLSTDDLRALPDIPYLKIHVTTRGLLGSTDVIRRGIRYAREFIAEAPDLYADKVSIEVCTESEEQAELLTCEFERYAASVDAVVLPVPHDYATPNGALLKARSLHYMVEQRRQGFNRKSGRTFIVHYDEESVMTPPELRRLMYYLATTGKPLTEGPIYYPFEYQDANVLCRAMESNRPLGCYECRHVMESGVPLHLHGSNLVIDEELENELGWDIGTLDGQPFIAEDYMFGVLAYLRKGPEVFGWHGAAMLEQPPFSVMSAFRQRSRWITGVLQGLSMVRRMPEYQDLPLQMRFHLIWDTRYRILTFALGLPTGALSVPYLLYQTWTALTGQGPFLLPTPFMLWIALVGFLWLNSSLIGAWYNLMSAQDMSPVERLVEGARVLMLAPVAGAVESAAGFWAVVKWVSGERTVSWTPTPKTKEADKAMAWEAA